MPVIYFLLLFLRLAFVGPAGEEASYVWTSRKVPLLHTTGLEGQTAPDTHTMEGSKGKTFLEHLLHFYRLVFFCCF